MSQALPCGRAMLRWSAAGQAAPALRAGLPASNARVKVGPPLSASAPSLGSAIVMLVLQLVSLKKFGLGFLGGYCILWPASVSASVQCCMIWIGQSVVLLANRVFLIVIVLPAIAPPLKPE